MQAARGRAGRAASDNGHVHGVFLPGWFHPTGPICEWGKLVGKEGEDNYVLGPI